MQHTFTLAAWNFRLARQHMNRGQKPLILLDFLK